MKEIGFSTGALACGDFRRALEMLRCRPGIRAVELSALRECELGPLVQALDDLDLSQFTYIAFHAPSRIESRTETEVVRLLAQVARRGWPIVVHPDAIATPHRWAELGDRLCIENSDKRKPAGRTTRELASIFELFPSAGFCFDIGHARQVDPTMTDAYFMLKAFGRRLLHIHVSEVNTRSTHDPLSYASIMAFRTVAEFIPADKPLILETPASAETIGLEIDKAIEALPLPQDALS